MLNKLGALKSKKGIIVLAIVTLLGWAGITVAEKDVNNVVNIFFEEGQTSQQSNIAEQADAEQASKLPTSDNATTEPPRVKEDFNKASAISPQRRAHILYGDATGGGHMFGAGKPCKSEFPKHWDEDTIIKEVELIAANDNLNWEQQRNGYYVTEQKVGTVNVRVVKGRAGEKVITAYPTNVPRNPCPANDR